MKTDKEYIINFGNLKIGSHHYDFHVEQSFFSEYDYSLVQEADIQVHLELEKEKETLLVLTFSYKGGIAVDCDRCLDTFIYPVNSNNKIIVKLTEKEIESGDEHLIYLPLDEWKIDLKPLIYEFINLELPLKKVCSQAGKKCNPEMLLTLERDGKENKEEIDPRWENLRSITSDENEETKNLEN